MFYVLCYNVIFSILFINILQDKKGWGPGTTIYEKQHCQRHPQTGSKARGLTGMSKDTSASTSHQSLRKDIVKQPC